MKVKGAGLYNNIKNNLNQIALMAERGMSRQQIGQYYGVSGQRIGQLIREHPDLEEAFNNGLAKGIDRVTNKLMELVDQGNIVAILFFLKCRAGWVEQQYLLNKPDTENAPRAVVYLPDNGRSEVRDDVIEGQLDFSEECENETAPG